VLSTDQSVSDSLAAVTAARQAKHDAAVLECYGAFRRITAGQFDEPVRPSILDVQGVADVLRGSLAYTLSQDQISFTETGGLGPEFGDLDGGHRYGTAEGRTHRIRISPGVIRSRTFDAARLEATKERVLDAARRSSDMLAGELLEDPDSAESAGAGSKSEIYEWSAKSRANLTETVGSLDFSDWPIAHGDLAMVTLTLPGDWLPLTPDGQTFKKMLKKFRERFEYHTGLPWRLLWKLEFQRRGAPHWHALMRVPVFVGAGVKKKMFPEWLSRTWADVVGASKERDRCDVRTREVYSEYERHLGAGTGIDFSGKDFTDPRRMGLYFLGHSSKTTDNKKYQHRVPRAWRGPGKGPGRFWGYVGLVKAVVELDVTERDQQILDRQLRKIKKARNWTVAVKRAGGAAIRAGGLSRDVDVFAVESPNRKRRYGRAAHRTANARARLAAHDRMEGPLRYSNKPGELLLHGPLTEQAWKHQKRSHYAPFSGGQGGFVLVNDALKLGLDLAYFLKARKENRGSWDGSVPPSVVGQVKDWGSNPYSRCSRRKCVTAPLLCIACSVLYD
jgi:hypothetical protein